MKADEFAHYKQFAAGLYQQPSRFAQAIVYQDRVKGAKLPPPWLWQVFSKAITIVSALALLGLCLTTSYCGSLPFTWFSDLFWCCKEEKVWPVNYSGKIVVGINIM